MLKRFTAVGRDVVRWLRASLMKAAAFSAVFNSPVHVTYGLANDDARISLFNVMGLACSLFLADGYG
jgi:hypothetical protein